MENKTDNRPIYEGQCMDDSMMFYISEKVTSKHDVVVASVDYFKNPLNENEIVAFDFRTLFNTLNMVEFAAVCSALNYQLKNCLYKRIVGCLHFPSGYEPPFVPTTPEELNKCLEEGVVDEEYELSAKTYLYWLEVIFKERHAIKNLYF